MREKSKFLTFLLSFIPGLSHFYLGIFERGLIYLLLFGGLTIGSIFMYEVSWDGFAVLGLGGGVIIWLIALLDAFSSINSMRYKDNMSEIEKNLNIEKTKKANKRIITLALSVIPGAGHMFLGYEKRGLLFMAGFFFTIFFMGWLNLSLLAFILPLIWFYSFFDAYHTLNGRIKAEMNLENIMPKIKQKYVGLGLIGIGILVMLQNMIYPLIQTYLDYGVINYIQTLIVSSIFIIGGIKMLQKKKEVEEVEDIEDIEEEIEDEE